MRALRLVSVLAGTALSAACGVVIFKADFPGSGSPAGSPPGAPSGDQIVVQSPVDPVVSNSQLVFHPSPQDKALFFSSPVQDPQETKTVFWIGHLTSGDGPFTFLLSADDTPGSIFLTNPIELKFTNNQVQVIGLPPANAVLHSHALLPNAEHHVFISLRLKSATYRMTIQQSGAPEIEFTGNLDPLTANWIKSKSRIVLEAGFLPNATATDQYQIDQVIMEELK